MKRFYYAYIALLILLSKSGFAQLSGTFTIPGTYSTLAFAIADINNQGVNGPVTMLVAAGYTEFAPVGGYSLYASGTNNNPITFQKNGVGANPILYAYSGGSGVPSSAVQDGIWKFFGCDYVTVDGINLLDQNLNNPSTMEYGFGFFKASVTNGCRYNTIKNCVISLKRVNNASGAGPASEGSRGIDVVNAIASSHTTALTVTSALGANSFNHFYNNVIQNCNIGIAVTGFMDSSPFLFADYDNDLGGTSAATSNTIVNFGGGTAGQNAYGIKTLAQYNLNASYNNINSNDGLGVNHPGGLYGIYSGTATSANVTIRNNTVSLKGSGTTFLHYGILNHAGATAANNTVTINDNLITNCSYTTATTGVFQAIVNAFVDPATLNLNNNSVTNNTCTSVSNGYFCIVNGGPANTINITGNQASNIHFINASGSPGFHFISNGAGAIGGTLTISSNSVSAITLSQGTGNAFYGIRINGNQFPARSNITDNVFGNLSIAADGLMCLINQANSTPTTLVSGNITTGTITKTGSGNTFYGYQQTGNSGAGSATITSNYFASVSTNSNAFYGIYTSTSAQQTVHVLSNTIANVSSANDQVTGIFLGFSSNNSIHHNLVTGLTGSADVSGILTHTNVSNTSSVYSNTLGSYTSVGFNSVYGYYHGGTSSLDFYQNKVYDLNGTNAGSKVFGVFINSGSTTNLSNNIIGNLNAPNANHPNAVNGIYINGGSAANVFYNTIRLNASSTGIDFGSSALYTSLSPVVNLRNNILINLSTPSGSAITVAYRRSAAGLSTYASSSNNNLFYAGVPSASNLVFSDATNQFQTISALKSFVNPMEAFSLTENTPFLSTVGTATNFLHVDPLLMSLTESAASTISGYSGDYDADIRQGQVGYTGSGIGPDIGADEFEGVYPNCSGVNTPSISALTASICVGQTLSLNANPEAPYPGVTRQWLISTSPNASFTSISGANTLSYSITGLPAGNYYYRFANTCTVSNMTDTSNVFSILVSPIPTVVVSPPTSTFCAGGNPIVLNASGANSYSWSPITGLSSGSTATVSASPAITTTYIVTGINPGNCMGAASAIVVGLPSAGGITVSPSSTTICQGNNLNLQAVSTNTAYSVSPITFSPIPTPISGVTTLCNNGSIITWPIAGGLDDGNWYGLPIPFTFSLFEVGYSSLGIGTDGHITLGAGFPNTLFGYNLALPTPSAAAPCIGAVYADLDFSYVGSINMFTTGTAPNRKLVVNWINGRYYTSNVGVGVVTTQAILYETSNMVEVHTTTCSGNNATVEGIQNSTGTQASTVPGRNTSHFSVSNDAYRWTFVKNVNWQPSTFLNSSTSFTPIAQNIQSSQVYTAIATTGNGCTVSATASITVIPSPTLSVSGISVPICAGTSVSISANASNSYTWNTGLQNAALQVTPAITTTYTASSSWSVNNCVAQAIKIVTVVPIPNLSILGSASLCNGKTGTFTAIGANTYSWNTGNTNPTFTVTANTNSVYTVYGTNTLASCSASLQLAVSVYPNPTVSVSGSTLICSGQNASLNATGANFYTWSTGTTAQSIFPTPLVTTVYSVTGYSGPANCSHVAVHVVSVNPSPLVSITAASSSTICEGEPVSLTATGSGADVFAWSNSSTDVSVTVTPQQTTIYSVQVTNSTTACKATASIEITVDVCEGLESLDLELIKIQPNPSAGEIIIKNVLGKTLEYELGDINGKILKKGQLNEKHTQISLEDLAKGMYYLRLPGTNDKVYRILKQ